MTVDTVPRHTVAARRVRSADILRKGGTHSNVAHQRTHVVPASRQDEEGQGLAEYALILALIAIVAIIALIFLGGQVSRILSTVGNSV